MTMWPNTPGEYILTMSPYFACNSSLYLSSLFPCLTRSSMFPSRGSAGGQGISSKSFRTGELSAAIEALDLAKHLPRYFLSLGEDNLLIEENILDISLTTEVTYRPCPLPCLTAWLSLPSLPREELYSITDQSTNQTTEYWARIHSAWQDIIILRSSIHLL